MLGNIIWLLGFVVVVILFAWLTRRAWGSKHKILKWPALLLAGLLTLIFALVTFVIGKGMLELYRPYPVAAVNVTIAGTPEQLARGEHLATVLCASCHTQNGELPLSGGNNLSEDSGLPLGDVIPPNITPGGKLKELSDADVYRIIRTGIEPSGRLTAMGFFPVRSLSDEDAQSIIAYIRRAKPVEGARPAFNASPLLAAFIGLGFIQPAGDASIRSVNAPTKAVNKEYGEYVLNFMDCKGCHGPTLSGDAPPPAPPGASNLTLFMPNWSKDDFFKTMRTGVDPNGNQVKPPMPWKQIGKLDDVELEALYTYLHGLTPVLRK